jgi:hypothetical protein
MTVASTIKLILPNSALARSIPYDRKTLIVQATGGGISQEGGERDI